VTGQFISTESLRAEQIEQFAGYGTVQKYALMSAVADRKVIFPVALYGCETRYMTLSEVQVSRI